MARICSGLVLVTAVWGQVGGDRLSFEVASVKLSANQEMITRMSGGPGTSDPGMFRAGNAELSVLVIRAYGIEYDQLMAPAWMDTIQFDVVAKVPPGTTAEEFRKMQQNLLAERFRMHLHHQTRVQPVYDLGVAKNGPKRTPGADGSGSDFFVPGRGRRRADRDNFPILPPGAPNMACAFLAQGSYCTFRMVTVGRLAQSMRLPNLAGSHVVDRTGLVGQYDFTLYFRRGIEPGPDADPPQSRPPSWNSLALSSRGPKPRSTCS